MDVPLYFHLGPVSVSAPASCSSERVRHFSWATRRVFKARVAQVVRLSVTDGVGGQLAARYGVSGNLIDFGRQAQVPFRQLVDEMIDSPLERFHENIPFGLCQALIEPVIEKCEKFGVLGGILIALTHRLRRCSSPLRI